MNNLHFFEKNLDLKNRFKNKIIEQKFQLF